jgi:hypothetical protein
MSTSLMALKASSEANTQEQKRLQERKRNILVLTHQYLVENGFIEAAERLQHEAGPSISKFEAADNMDLNLIMTEYEAYYEMRFEKKPKFIKKSKEDDMPKPKMGVKPQDASTKKTRKVNDSSPTPNEEDSMSVMGVEGKSVNSDAAKGKKADTASTDKFEDRMLKPPPQFGGDAEMKQLAAVISREIYQESPNVR